ncbi:hypothetical protein [Brevundimonas naejangsanensis]|uniref:hypothetical protein n=1 Tax=Brevundimonas naejangsanensis TaxID=588932 RepID=UPI00320B70EA
MTDEAEAVFQGAMEELAKIGGFSNMVSIELRGRPTDRPGELASMVHAKMCAHARSIGAIVQSPVFDHSAIVGLSRMILEGLTMYAYLKQAVSEPVWAMRETVLKLHDTVARITLLRAYREKSEYQDLRDGRTELLRVLETNAEFGELPEEQKSILRNGSVIFVGGMRRAAREAGWNEDRFTAMYNYLSAHVHGAPMSYFRTREHGVDYYAPSEAQKAIAATAISIATACLRRASLLQIAEMDWRAHAVFAVSVDEFIAEDSACDVFG